MTVPANGAFARPIGNSRLGGKVSKNFLWSRVNLKVVCADGAFPVGSVWQRSLSHGCRKVLYSFSDVVGGWKVWILMSSNADVVSVLLILSGVGQGWNNERAVRGDLQVGARHCSKVSRCEWTAKWTQTNNSAMALHRRHSNVTSLWVFLFCVAGCAYKITHLNLGTRMGKRKHCVLLGVAFTITSDADTP